MMRRWLRIVRRSGDARRGRRKGNGSGNGVDMDMDERFWDGGKCVHMKINILRVYEESYIPCYLQREYVWQE